MGKQWCKSTTCSGHTCRRKAAENGLCWQHAAGERKSFAPWTCEVCGEVLKNLPWMAGKPVTEAQASYINGLLVTRVVTTDEASNAKLWLHAAEDTGEGRDIASILIHQLLHKEKVGRYRQSYLG